MLDPAVRPVSDRFQLQVSGDRRTSDVEVNLQSGVVARSVQVDEVEVTPPVPLDMRGYAYETVVAGRWDGWCQHARRNVGKELRADSFLSPTGRGMTFGIDAPLGVMEPLLGRGAKITVRGSERITMSGTSRWDAALTETDTRRQSKFPQLDLRQDLNITVDGQVGDKVTIDWQENSNAETSLANRISIRYRGYDDEVIRTLDLGNTSLSLPGTGFVSYNGQHRGLFGVKTVSQLGDYDLTVIASKQEGQTATSSYTGRAQETQRQINDIDHVQRRFFFLVDPVDPLLTGRLVAPDDEDWVPPPTVEFSTLRVWRDDNNQTNNGSTVPADLWLDPSERDGENANPIEGNFDLLTEQQDYILRPDLFSVTVTRHDGSEALVRYVVLDMQRPIGTQERLGATFVATYEVPDGAGGQRDSVVVYGSIDPVSGNILEGQRAAIKALRVLPGDFNQIAGDFYSPEDYWYPSLRLELRNIYDLQARDIDLTTLELKVRERRGEDRDYVGDDPERTFLRMLGVDKRDEFDNPGFDDIIDRSGVVYEADGLIVLPDLRPFSPAAIDSVWPFFRVDLEDPDLPPPPAEACDPLRTAPSTVDRPAYFVCDLANRAIYDKRFINRGEDNRYYLDVRYATPQTQFILNAAGTIMEGSETVTVDGRALQRGRDYHIDYETGIVNLTGQADVPSDAQVNIDYAFAPLFALGQKTLMGFNVGWNPAADRRFSATWLFESSGVSERRPKLGEEPSRTIVGALSGGFNSRPFWMTQLVEGLPLLRANADSRLDFSGELALSIPNPNTRGQVYVDDFEGAKETSVLSISREQWFWSSRPDSIAALPPAFRRGNVIWYNPVISPVRERDLFPTLDQLEGDDRKQILMLRLEPRADIAAAESWFGLTQGLSSGGADFSRKQFIEVWINDFRSEDIRGLGPGMGTGARMIIDLGTISEDAEWGPDTPPNSERDSEDINQDGILDLNEEVEDGYEDTGLDGLRNSAEQGDGPPSDPGGDDFSFDRTAGEDAFNYDAYRRINRTEDNRRLDDEDLNRDNIHQRGSNSNNYFQYTVDLGDTLWVATDVYDDFGQPAATENGPNGWRLFRIPVEEGEPVGSPSLGAVRHLRVWFTGLTDTATVQIASIAVQGNLYQTETLRDSTGTPVEPAADEVFKLRGINNKEDANEYVPPFALEQRDRVTEREGSLALDFVNLRPGHEGTAFRAFPNDRDYALYETLKWWIYGGVDPFTRQPVAGVEAFVRFGTDTLTYYEYALPINSSGWTEVIIPISDLSNLKLRAPPDSTSYEERDASGRLLRMVRSPSFTRVRRVTFGVRNVSDQSRSGTIWFDDIRLDDVIRDWGTATRFNLTADLADFMSLGADLTTQDEDFQSIGSSGRRAISRGSGTRRRDFRFRSNTNLHKFFETSGIKMPLAFNYSETLELPLFRAGDDVILDEETSLGQKRGSQSRSLALNFSRAGANSPFWVRYTLDALRADFRLQDRRSLTQTRRDSSRAINVGLSYSISPRLRPFKIGKTEISYFPQNLSLSSRLASDHRFSFGRNVEDPQERRMISSNFYKQATLNASGSLSPVRSLTSSYRVDSTRDLTQENRADWLFGFNIGAETRRNQSVSVGWTPSLGRLAPNVRFSGNSTDDHSPNLRLATDPEQVRNLSAGQNITGGLTVPITMLTGRGVAVPGDTTGGVFRSMQRGLARLGRFQDIRVSLSQSQSKSFSYATGVPRWQYYLGFAMHPGTDVRLTSRGRENFSKRRSHNLSSGIDFVGGITATTSFGFTKSQSEASFSAPRITTTTTWPDVNVSWRQVHNRLPIRRVFRQLNIDSRYGRDRSESGPSGDENQIIDVRSNWQPLLRLNGTLTSGWQTRFEVSANTTLHFDDNAGLGQFSESRRRQLSINFSRRFDQRSGFKLPWRQAPLPLKGDLSLNFDISRSTDYAENGRRGQDATITRDISNTTFRTGSTYGFKRNIDATFSFNFGFNNNNKTGQKLRTMSLSMSILFNF